jgi:hypothetical protein
MVFYARYFSTKQAMTSSTFQATIAGATFQQAAWSLSSYTGLEKSNGKYT